MRYTPKKNLKSGISLSALFVLGSMFFLFFSTAWGDFLSNLFKIISAILFALALTTITRFLTFTYTYVADDEFLIIRSSPFASKTVCRLYYTDIIEIKKLSAKEKSKDKGYEKLYNYCPSPSRKDAYLLIYNIGGENCAVMFTPDLYFVNHLEKYLKNDIII
jgi:hypothetical protein